MKKIFLLTIAIIAIATNCEAQKFIDVYQGGKITGSMFSADLDSINVTGSGTSRMLNFWGRGSLANSYNVSTVDSVKVFRSDDEPLVYLGIVGFNQELYPKAVDILASSTSNLYTSFVSNLERKAGTLLYYGVDQALDILTKYDFSTPLSSVNLITFTDGLDQGSLMMNSNYQTDGAYLQALSKRISSTKVRGLKLTAYSLGLRGNDVSDYAQFQTNLRQLATTEDKAIEVSSMYDVENRLQEIADQIISISNRQKISMKIPGVSNGTRIRFTFDGNSPEYSTMYIEGTFNLSDRSLRNVNYYGMRASSGSFIRGEQDGIFVTFTFTGLQRIDGSGLIPTNYIRQYNKATSSSAWQNNSEFSPSNNTQTTITHSGAAIMLVLDCSSSLGSQFSNMKNYAQNFIFRVANNTAQFSIMPPKNVKATLDDDDLVIYLTWDAVKYAESYDVYRNGTLIQEDVRATSWTDNSPIRNNVYTIKAKGHGLTSELSQPSERISTIPANGLSITVNGVQFTMIKVEGGTFQMGSTSGYSNERPVHQVTLTNDYYIGETEVTQELWTAVMGSNPSYFKSSNQLPVEGVSWNDFQTFITKLNALTGRTFRLPTEAEWEFAARGGNASVGYTYSGSNNVSDVAWYSCHKTHDVATKAPNELGIYDMSGNVEEWCQDWYGRYSSEAQIDPTGPTSGSYRVHRGGCWGSGDGDCRVARRGWHDASDPYMDIGFRLAL